MNITIKNFGPIREFEFDLSRNISLIYGKNNIGKSYAITAIYLLLKSFPQVKQESVLVMIFDKYFTKYWRSESTETLVKIFTNRSAISVEQRKFIDDIIRNSIAEMLEVWFVKDFSDCLSHLMVLLIH
ncbi:MAG: AAA family ATPase [Ignavibacteriales bacterium]|nr:AAA family ATPase [Ignavibacteriales bacterium]